MQFFYDQIYIGDKTKGCSRVFGGEGFLQGRSSKTQFEHDNVEEVVRQFRKNGPTAFGKRYTNHSLEFKMDVLNYLERTGTSTTETAVVFNSTVWKWKQLFDTGGIDALQPKAKGRPS